jgi:hypothetical protein
VRRAQRNLRTGALTQHQQVKEGLQRVYVYLQRSDGLGGDSLMMSHAIGFRLRSELLFLLAATVWETVIPNSQVERFGSSFYPAMTDDRD